MSQQCGAGWADGTGRLPGGSGQLANDRIAGIAN